MKDMQREILNQVATGQISASEGAARIEALGAQPAVAAAVEAPALPPAAAVANAKTIRVVSQVGSATVVGDPTVALATADGPHSARQDGDTLIIETGLLAQDDTFSFGTTGRLLSGLRRQRDDLVVRMNPDLSLVARVRAGDVRVVGVHGPITAEVQAGDCKIEDFRGQLHASVQAGSITAAGRIDRGSSSIRCQMGEVKLNLEKGSSVRISAHTTLGEISIDGASMKRAQLGNEVTLGAGAGTLDLECTMGDIQVNAE